MNAKLTRLPCGCLVSALRIVTDHVYPPIPDRRWDWSAVTDNYEPGEPIGHGRTEQAAIDDLLQQLEDSQ